LGLLDFLPFYSLAFFALVTTPLGLIRSRRSQTSLGPFVGLFGLAVALGSAVWLGFRAVQSPMSNPPPAISTDLFTLFFTGVLISVSIFVGVASLTFMKGDQNEAPYFGLLLLSTLGMIVLAASLDLILLYVGWELMSIPTYALTAFRKKDPNSNEAAMKFFVLSALSSALIVYAISLVFGVTGSTNLVTIASQLGSIGPDTRAFGVLAIVLFIVGFGVKMAVVPFHMWIPDAFEGAPTTIAAFLAAGAKMASFAAAFRVFLIGMSLFHVDWYSTFALVAVATMTLGNVAALMQKSFTRLLAYSSIAQAGYIIIALAAPVTSSGAPLGLTGGLFHVLNYSILKTAAFIAAAAVATHLPINNLDSFNGLSRRMPQTSFNIAILFLGLAGVPPLSGFFSKAMLFTGAVGSPSGWGGYLAIAALINSGFSMGYYGWLIKRMYFDEPSELTRLSEPRGYLVVLWAASILTIVIGIYPQPWINLSQSAANALMRNVPVPAP
jgi:NADH-quinone oxidoreductase subunit N